MVVKFPAPAAVAVLLLSATVAPQTVAQQTAAQHEALASDSSFIQTAGSLALLQVRLGKMAEEKGSSAVVKDFGKRMQADYAKASEELGAGAKQSAYPAPVLLRQHKQLVEKFMGTSRSSFDRKYMAEMVNAHEEAVRLFKQESESGRVAVLKQLASKMLPTMQQHLALATQTAG
jgi:putative membrane protein